MLVHSASHYHMPVIYLFIYSLFNDAVSSSNYTASNDNIANEELSGKDTEV
jgi:hypothetical protein